MSALKVGDVCEFVGLHSRCQEFNGTECVILSGLAERYGCDSHRYEMCHEVRCALDGSVRLCQPQYLRRRKPPEEPIRQELGDWDLCPWRPSLPVKELV